MNIVLFTHPAFLGSQSHTRMAAMLSEAYRARGHTVEVRQPVAGVRRWVRGAAAQKWAGYLDQYLLFGLELRLRARRDPADTLYVFCDQALGPWVPAVTHRPHVVHCNDLLALRAALGLIPEQPTSWTGRLYQRYIRWGFRHARHFISISSRTRRDLHEFGGVTAMTSEVVPLGLNHPYRPLGAHEAEARLRGRDLAPPPQGLLLHVGGGQWYKNLDGVLALYAALAREGTAHDRAVPALWVVGPPPQAAQAERISALPPGATVRFLQGVDNAMLEALYGCARMLLFPSLAEGFGWPIAEALACGCPVLTTDDEPMSEVGGSHAHYLPRMPQGAKAAEWAEQGARQIQTLLDEPGELRAARSARGIEWASRYEPHHAIDRYLELYQQVLHQHPSASTEPVVV